MKRWQYVVAWALGVACLATSAGSIWLAQQNLRLQREAQEQGALLERGILGQRGQQIGNNLMQDLVAAARHDAAIYTLLTRHGYTVPASAPVPASNRVEAAAAPAAASGGDAP